jgi:hypothetical protein
LVDKIKSLKKQTREWTRSHAVRLSLRCRLIIPQSHGNGCRGGGILGLHGLEKEEAVAKKRQGADATTKEEVLNSAEWSRRLCAVVVAIVGVVVVAVIVVVAHQPVACWVLGPGSSPHQIAHHHSTKSTTNTAHSTGKAKAGQKKTATEDTNKKKRDHLLFAPEENSQPNIRNTRKGINRSSREEGKEDNKRSKWERLSKKSREAVDERRSFFSPSPSFFLPGTTRFAAADGLGQATIQWAGLRGDLLDEGGDKSYWPGGEGVRVDLLPTDVRDLRSRSAGWHSY